MFPAVIPGKAAVDVAAPAAGADAGKGVLGGINPALFPILAAEKVRPADHLLLGKREDVFRNDGGPAVFHVVLWKRAVILDAGLLNEKYMVF